MTSSSFFLVVALATFALGVILYLISISSTAWQGLSDEFTISLWKECYKRHVTNQWSCESWHVIPECRRYPLKQTVLALETFALGVILYLISISSTAWQGLSDEFTISLWKECYKRHVTNQWSCESWHVIPDFVRSAQAFCIVSLLCYIVCSCILVASFILRCVHRSRIALIVISLLTFTSACMIAMAVVVMGLKGKDHLTDLKSDPDVIYQYFLRGTVIAGNYTIGWALILAIIASLVNFISFIFFLLEYKDMTDMPRPTKV